MAPAAPIPSIFERYCYRSTMEGNMKHKLILSLIACAGLSFASATLALADDPAPDTSATGSSTDTTQTTPPPASDSGNGTGGGSGMDSGDNTQK